MDRGELPSPSEAVRHLPLPSRGYECLVPGAGDKGLDRARLAARIWRHGTEYIEAGHLHPGDGPVRRDALFLSGRGDGRSVADEFRHGGTAVAIPAPDPDRRDDLGPGLQRAW